MAGIGLGDIPAWLSAAISTFALIAASIAAYQTKKIYELESERDRQNLIERKKAQASRVSVWVTFRRSSDRSGVDIPTIVARNASDLPIYDLDIELLSNRGELIGRQSTDVFPPTDTPVEFPQLLIHEAGNPSAGQGSGPLKARVSFRDAAGLLWVREIDGLLLEQRDRRPAQLTRSPPPSLLTSRE